MLHSFPSASTLLNHYSSSRYRAYGPVIILHFLEFFTPVWVKILWCTDVLMTLDRWVHRSASYTFGSSSQCLHECLYSSLHNSISEVHWGYRVEIFVRQCARYLASRGCNTRAIWPVWDATMSCRKLFPFCIHNAQQITMGCNGINVVLDF